MLYVYDIRHEKILFGPNAGKNALNVLFSGCNMDCDNCDRKYILARKNRKVKYYSVYRLYELIKNEMNDDEIVVLDGGDALIQVQSELWELVSVLSYNGVKVEVITSGMISPYIPSELKFGDVFVLILPRYDYAKYTIDFFNVYKSIYDIFGIKSVILFEFDCERLVDMHKMINYIKEKAPEFDIYLYSMNRSGVVLDCLKQVWELSMKDLGVKYNASLTLIR